MSRGFIIILIMQLGFFIHGCAALEYIDGSSKEEIKKFKMAGYGMRNEMEKVRAENVNLQRQIDILNTLRKEKQRIIDENESKIAGMREENVLLNEKINNLIKENQRKREENESKTARMREENESKTARMREENVLLNEKINNLINENQRIIDENENEIAGMKWENESKIARIREENELLNEEIKKLKSENQRVKYENKSLVKILTRQKETLSSKSHALEKDIQGLKIKILSIDSKNSAEKMAKKLRAIGYEIKSISYAPRSNFLRNTVYFAPEFKDKAEQLVASLGGKTTFKPLNWPSVFDLIVVTGKNP
jgi:chromosome segregation ATPase